MINRIIGLLMMGLVVSVVSGCGSKFAKDFAGGFLEVGESFSEGFTQGMAKSGLKATGSVYGYERSNDKSLKVVESESVVVSKIFKLYSEHKSLSKVAESLNRQKIETRRGIPFSRMTIKNILNNKTYAGRIVHNGMETKGIHKSIVSTRMWNRCNEMLSG